MGAVSSVPDYIGGAVKKTDAILAAPLVGSLDSVHLFLMLGVVLLSVLIWTRILAHIKG
jgi:hypothetical protein